MDSLKTTHMSKTEPVLRIQNLSLSLPNKKNITLDFLELNRGDRIHLKGGNGSGKTSLAFSLIGHPNYPAKGSIQVGGFELSNLDPWERVEKGLILLWQQPPTLKGINLLQTTRQLNRLQCNTSYPEYLLQLNEQLDSLALSKSIKEKSLFQHFSGGEKKKVEFLHLMQCHPLVAILDEIDAGLDQESLDYIISQLNNEFKDVALIIISHNAYFVDQLKPQQIKTV